MLVLLMIDLWGFVLLFMPGGYFIIVIDFKFLFGIIYSSYMKHFGHHVCIKGAT